MLGRLDGELRPEWLVRRKRQLPKIRERNDVPSAKLHGLDAHEHALMRRHRDLHADDGDDNDVRRVQV